MAFQSSHNQPLNDLEVYQQVIEVATMAEPRGYSSICAVEHHFTNYTMCPNPIEVNCFSTYAGMDYEAVKKSMTLFAEQALPVLRDWQYQEAVA